MITGLYIIIWYSHSLLQIVCGYLGYLYFFYIYIQYPIKTNFETFPTFDQVTIPWINLTSILLRFCKLLLNDDMNIIGKFVYLWIGTILFLDIETFLDTYIIIYKDNSKALMLSFVLTIISLIIIYRFYLITQMLNWPKSI